MGAIFTNIAEIFNRYTYRAQIFFTEGGWKYAVMLAVACVLLYLAIVKQFEPLLLLPIGFGMLMTNLPLDGNFPHRDLPQRDQPHQLGAAGQFRRHGGLYLLRRQAGHLSPADLPGHRYHDRLHPADRPSVQPAAGCGGPAGHLLHLHRCQRSWASPTRKLPPSASSAVPTVPRPSLSPPVWRPICWVPLRWRPTVTWPWCRSSSRPSCGS